MRTKRCSSACSVAATAPEPTAQAARSQARSRSQAEIAGEVAGEMAGEVAGVRERDACCATAVEGGSFTRAVAGQSGAFGGGRRVRGRTLSARVLELLCAPLPTHRADARVYRL